VRLLDEPSALLARHPFNLRARAPRLALDLLGASVGVGDDPLGLLLGRVAAFLAVGVGLDLRPPPQVVGLLAR
jgi:hypothetical protein